MQSERPAPAPGHGLTARRRPPILAGMTADRAPRDWTAADLRTIGYFAKVPGRRPEWLRAPAVERVCGASCCVAARRLPDEAIFQGNGLSLFDTLAALDPFVPADAADTFVRFAYRSLPVDFGSVAGGAAQGDKPLDLANVRPEPIPLHFVRLGYDVCSRHHTLECSPLSCNGKAAEIATNRWCLLDDFEVALRLAREWGSAGGIGVEPGPYVLLEVWADRLPDQVSG
jgi:hypothetical protein